MAITELALAAGKAATTAAAKALGALASRKSISKYERQRIADEAMGTLTSGVATADWKKGRHPILHKDFAASLSARQVEIFLDFVQSMQFEAIIRQATILFRNDETRAILREQLRHGLRHRGDLSGADLLLATDVLEELMYGAVDAVRRSSANTSRFADSREVLTAASVAAAAVRNSDLLARISTISAFQDFGERLRAAANFGYAKLEVAANSARLRVDYSQLYVSPHLISMSPVPHSMLDSSEKPTPISDLLEGQQRCVILGDPGAGKSTLSSKLMHDLAIDSYDGFEGQIPLLLRVREHIKSLRSEHQVLLYYLDAACRRPHNLVPPTDALEYILLNGIATVVIDGVDELGDSSQRRSFLDLIEGFVHLYPLARVVVTSRVVGYSDAPLDAELFPAYRLKPFNNDQVVEYVKNWFAIERVAEPASTESIVESFMRESEPASDLRSNALLLSLLCSLYSARGYIPNNRPEIYNKCANLLFETWDRQRGIETIHRYEASIRPAVQKMALYLFRDEKKRQALSRTEWTAFLADYLHARRFPDYHDAELAAADFLDFCAGRAWVITDVDSDQLNPQYGFVHKTFLEYFAAAQLVKERPRPAAVLDKLRPYVADSSWRVIAQLAVQILNETYDDGADELLRMMIIDLASVGRRGAELSSHLDFMASMLDIVSPYSDTVEAIVRRIVGLSCEVPVQKRRTVPEAPWPRSSGPIHLVGATDEPLATLLSITAPDNVERVADGIVLQLLESSESMQVDSSAAMIYAFLRHQDQNLSTVSYLVGKRLARLPTPAVVEAWHRLLNRPIVDDLRDHGIKLLFQRTFVLGQFLDTPLNGIIKSLDVLALPRAEFASTLVSIDSLLASYLPYLRTAHRDRRRLNLEDREAPYDSWVWLVQQRSLLSAEARAALKILLWVDSPEVGDADSRASN